MLQGIRHIIFDLGGVLLNIDYNATEEAFAELGITDFAERYSQLRQNNFFDDWETGKLCRADFIKGMQKAGSPAILSEEEVLQAWNAMLLDFPLRRLQLLQQLRLHYDLFLLSNTNEVHEEAFNELLMKTHRFQTIGLFFDRTYLSHRVGKRKPGKEIFLQILEENELLPEHTLFIDDSPQHIATAQTLGTQTIYLEKGMTIEEHIFLPK